MFRVLCCRQQQQQRWRRRGQILRPGRPLCYPTSVLCTADSAATQHTSVKNLNRLNDCHHKHHYQLLYFSINCIHKMSNSYAVVTFWGAISCRYYHNLYGYGLYYYYEYVYECKHIQYNWSHSFNTCQILYDYTHSQYIIVDEKQTLKTPYNKL